MAALQLKARIERRWWLSWYVAGLLIFCELFDTEPNWSRVDWWLKRGMKIEVWNGVRWRRIA